MNTQAAPFLFTSVGTSLAPAVYLPGGTVAAGRAGGRLSAITGTGVAVCLWSAEAGVGGVAHFVLPSGSPGIMDGHRGHESALRELLARILELAPGAAPRLRARLAGGASLLGPLSAGEPLGGRNARAARQWLAQRDIPVDSEDCGGASCRKIEFDIGTGRLTVKVIHSGAGEVTP